MSALESGDVSTIAVSGARFAVDALGVYASTVTATADAAFAAGNFLQGTEALASATAANAVAAGIAEYIPVLNLINAVVHFEENPLGLLAAAVVYIPVYGQIAALVITVVSMLIGQDGPPMQLGEAQATWDESGNLAFDSVREQEGGGERARDILGNIIQTVDSQLGKAELALIPGKTPYLGYVIEPSQDNADVMNLQWVDAQGVYHVQCYDREGNPVQGRHEMPPGKVNITQDFIHIAAEQGAIVPAWQAQTLRQTWVQDNAAAVQLDARIAALEEQATPLRPVLHNMGEGEGSGTAWSASADPEQLAALDAEIADLQAQANALREQAQSKLDESIAQLRRLDDTMQPQSEDGLVHYSAFTIDAPNAARPQSDDENKTLIDVDGDGFAQLSSWITKTQAVLAVNQDLDARISAGDLLNADTLAWMDADRNQRIDN
ncbi:MAG: hypothetical protein Q7U75_12305, partial [Desulfobacterales bacterium]|nr:hypothetical protein [Desulfobacterales bacterium]